MDEATGSLAARHLLLDARQEQVTAGLICHFTIHIVQVWVSLEVPKSRSLTWVILEAHAQEEKSFQLEFASFGEEVGAFADVAGQIVDRVAIKWYKSRQKQVEDTAEGPNIG